MISINQYLQIIRQLNYDSGRSYICLHSIVRIAMKGVCFDKILCRVFYYRKTGVVFKNSLNIWNKAHTPRTLTQESKKIRAERPFVIPF